MPMRNYKTDMNHLNFFLFIIFLFTDHSVGKKRLKRHLRVSINFYQLDKKIFQQKSFLFSIFSINVKSMIF